MEPPVKFDLATTCVKLDGDDGGNLVEVDDAFWEQIDSRPQFSHGRLVMKSRFEADWPTWEIHPSGPELVMLLSGAVDFVLRLAGGEHTVPMQPGDAYLVPANTWHTARVRDTAEMLFITPCAGTRNAAVP